MAKLPNSEAASIDPRKVTHYLLDPRHPDGGPKAAYFMRFGFREEDPKPLMEALLEHGRFNEVVRRAASRVPLSFPARRVKRSPRMDEAGRPHRTF